jgi:DNA-directed RNA polymerase subunit RPC12/RpoP
MPPKRKIAESESKVKVERDEVVEEAQTKKKQKKSTKQPVTVKEKILHLLAKEDKLIGLATIKKILKNEYEIDDSKANNSRIAKALKELEEEERDDFGKIGGSYHAGESSTAYQVHATEEAAKEAERKFLEEHEDVYQCPYCKSWNDEMKSWKGEDSIARGSKYQCLTCKEFFYSWISDWSTNKVGHTVEYKKGCNDYCHD